MSQFAPYQPGNQNQKNSKKNKRARNRNRVNNNRVVRRRGMRRGRSYFIPAAYRTDLSTNASINVLNGRTTLFSREIFPIVKSENEIFDLMIPMTPTKWTGTRTSALASTYQSFRPLYVSISFMPTNGTSTAGSLAVGTLWDGNSSDINSRTAAITQLPSMNGGFLTSLYTRCSRRVGLGTSLRANTFPTGDINSDDIPFWIICTCDSGNITNNGTVGNLVVTSRFALHNAINRSVSSTGALNIPATIQKEAAQTPTYSILKVAKNVVSSILSEGRDYWFTFPRYVLNGQSEPLLRPLQFLTAELFNTTTTDYEFKLDVDFDPITTCRTYLMGSNEQNFQ